jgi:hypothetical protein
MSTAGKKKSGFNIGKVYNPYKRSGMAQELDTRFQGRLGNIIRAGDPVTIENPSKKSGLNLKPSPPRSARSQRQRCITSFSSRRRPHSSAQCPHRPRYQQLPSQHSWRRQSHQPTGRYEGRHLHNTKIPKMPNFLPQEFQITRRQRLWKKIGARLNETNNK